MEREVARLPGSRNEIIDDAGQPLWIVRRSEVGAGEAIEDPALAAARIRDWLLGGDGRNRGALLDVYHRLAGLGPADSDGLTERDLDMRVRPALERALRTRAWVLVRRPLPETKIASATIFSFLPRAEPPDEEDDTPLTAQPAPDTTFVEILVVDEQGRPFADRPFQIRLPDQSVRNSLLGSDGLARFDGIDPGTVDVLFPRDDRDPVDGEDVPPPPAPPPVDGGGAPTQTATIEIADDMGRPLTDFPFQVTLADGTVVSGRTDEQGRAQVAGVTDSDCRVSLPSLDGSAWDVANG